MLINHALSLSPDVIDSIVANNNAAKYTPDR